MTVRFAPGDPIRVRPGRPGAKPGLVRTPHYLKGKTGRVESVLGRYRNPEDLAYGLSGSPEHVLYKVGFRQGVLWPEYEGPSDKRLYAEVYEHWLESEGEA